MAGAEDLGKRLLAEVDEVGLDEVFHALRIQNESQGRKYFNFQPLDRLLQTATSHTDGLKTIPALPIVELLSAIPGGGKTHLLYHLTALAVLPHALGGKNACAIILDTDSAFSIPRLAAQTRLRLQQQQAQMTESDIQMQTMEALKHIHIFRPQSLASTIATIDILPSYLFAQKRHHSFDRPVGFIALDSASAFYWQDRANIEEAAALTTQPNQASGYVKLASALRTTCAAFHCPAIFTTRHNGPISRSSGQQQRSFRPPISSLPTTLRMVVQRVPIRKFPPKISVAGALREADARKQAVDAGKFEAFVNEWGLEPGVMRKYEGVGVGFGFKITREGVVVNERDVG